MRLMRLPYCVVKIFDADRSAVVRHNCCSIAFYVVVSYSKNEY